MPGLGVTGVGGETWAVAVAGAGARVGAGAGAAGAGVGRGALGGRRGMVFGGETSGLSTETRACSERPVSGTGGPVAIWPSEPSPPSPPPAATNVPASSSASGPISETPATLATCLLQSRTSPISPW